MTMKHIAIIGIAAAAALAYAPSAIPANAHGGGFKMHSGHFGKHFRHGRHKNFNQW
jgi:Spy/CpxP family protein refolding chaperone